MWTESEFRILKTLLSSQISDYFPLRIQTNKQKNVSLILFHLQHILLLV